MIMAFLFLGKQIYKVFTIYPFLNKISLHSLSRVEIQRGKDLPMYLIILQGRKTMNAQVTQRIGKGLMTALIAAAFILPANAWARKGNCDMSGKGKGGTCRLWTNPQMVEDLALTPDQIQKLKEADFAAREKQLPLQAEFSALRLQLERAFSSNPVDEKAILDLTEKLNTVKGQMTLQKTESKLAMKKLLTPEQAEKLPLLRGGCNSKNNCDLKGNKGNKKGNCNLNR
jgi:Spy/CpxP family protein refolding chaperone